MTSSLILMHCCGFSLYCSQIANRGLHPSHPLMLYRCHCVNGGLFYSSKVKLYYWSRLHSQRYLIYGSSPTASSDRLLLPVTLKGQAGIDNGWMDGWKIIYNSLLCWMSPHAWSWCGNLMLSANVSYLWTKYNFHKIIYSIICQIIEKYCTHEVMVNT